MKKLVRGIYAAFLLLFFLTAIWSCKESKTYKIGVSQCSQDDWRMKMNDEIEREIMFHEDASVEIRSADDSNQKQINDIRYFADNGFDIIIVSPNESAALTPIIKEIYKNNTSVKNFLTHISEPRHSLNSGI